MFEVRLATYQGRLEDCHPKQNSGTSPRIRRRLQNSKLSPYVLSPKRMNSADRVWFHDAFGEHTVGFEAFIQCVRNTAGQISNGKAVLPKQLFAALATYTSALNA